MESFSALTGERERRREGVKIYKSPLDSYRCGVTRNQMHREGRIHRGTKRRRRGIKKKMVRIPVPIRRIKMRRIIL